MTGLEFSPHPHWNTVTFTSFFLPQPSLPVVVSTLPWEKNTSTCYRTTQNWILFLPLFKTDDLHCMYAPFWILQSLIRSLLWKYWNLPGAHVSSYPVKDGLRLLWVFKNSILMTTHPKPGCVSLTVIRSYIKSRRAAITDPEQPSAGAGLQLRWSPAMRRGPWI